MFSRRRLFMRTSALGGSLSLSGLELFAASDFWNKKESAQWTPQEIEILKTKSPWAKKVHGEIAGGAGRFGGGSGGAGGEGGGSRGGFGGDISGADSNGGGGGGGGRRGGRGGGGDAGGGGFAAVPQGPEVVIRWESAAPVLEATKFKLPEPL